jgi:hypothetical protein
MALKCRPPDSIGAMIDDETDLPVGGQPAFITAGTPISTFH